MIQKILSGLVIGLLFVCGCTPQPPSITWYSVTSPDESFVVDMPTEPRTIQRQTPIAQGGSIDVFMYESVVGETLYEAGRAIFPVGYIDSLGDSNEAVFDNNRDSLVEQMKAEIVQDKKGTYQGFPQRTLKLKFFNTKIEREAFLDKVMILSGQKLFTAQTIVPMDGTSKAQPQLTRFYNSFQPKVN